MSLSIPLNHGIPDEAPCPSPDGLSFPFRVLCRHHHMGRKPLLCAAMTPGHTTVLAPHRNYWNGLFMSVPSPGWRASEVVFPVKAIFCLLFLLCTHMSISDCFTTSWGTERETGLDSPIWLLSVNRPLGAESSLLHSLNLPGLAQYLLQPSGLFSKPLLIWRGKCCKEIFLNSCTFFLANPHLLLYILIIF